MREDELIVLMKNSGFNSRDIKKVRELSIINITTMENALYMLSSMYFRLIIVHATVAFIVCVFFILDCVENDGTDYTSLLATAIMFVLCHSAIRQVGPLRLAFKACRMLKELQKISKTHH